MRTSGEVGEPEAIEGKKAMNEEPKPGESLVRMLIVGLVLVIAGAAIIMMFV